MLENIQKYVDKFVGHVFTTAMSQAVVHHIKKELESSASTNTASLKLFYSQVEDLVTCDHCTDSEKLEGIKALVAVEQQRT